MIVAKFNFFFHDKANDKKNLKNNFLPHKELQQKNICIVNKRKKEKRRKMS